MDKPLALNRITHDAYVSSEGYKGDKVKAKVIFPSTLPVLPVHDEGTPAPARSGLRDVMQQHNNRLPIAFPSVHTCLAVTWQTGSRPVS